MTRRILLTAALFLLLIPLLSTAQNQTQPITTIDFYGTIDTMFRTTLTINGRTVDFSGATVTSPVLAPGMTVHVRAQVAPDYTLIAEQIDYIPVGFIPGLVELNGTISEIDGTTIRMGDQIVDVANARLVDPLAIGQQVQVFAYATYANDTAMWQARLVSLAGNLLPPS